MDPVGSSRNLCSGKITREDQLKIVNFHDVYLVVEEPIPIGTEFAKAKTKEPFPVYLKKRSHWLKSYTSSMLFLSEWDRRFLLIVVFVVYL